MSDATADPKGFRIGAVARLTGISPDALRVWERRYRVITPQRSPSGTRLYSEQDVERLRLIKRLVDAGQAIGTVAKLAMDELQARVRELAIGGVSMPSRPVRLLLAGPTLPVRLAAAEAGELLRVVGTFQDLAALERTDIPTDVLLVECPTLDEHSSHRLRRARRLTGARQLLVVYGFAPKDVVATVEAEGATLLRFPVNWETVRRYCLGAQAEAANRGDWQEADMTAVIGAPIPARRFDDAQLARAGMITTSIQCECPHHLADLIIALSRFERYSAQCEARNEQDAALHAYLHGATARARAVMEGALAQLLDMEGLDVGEPGT